MNVSIIAFSPSGHTLQAAKMMQAALQEQSFRTQIVDVTRQKEVFTQHRLLDFLQENVEAHEVLLVGGPVYAGHLEGTAKEIIAALPPPDEKWGRLAVPFITYGGLHSSVALQEAGALLHAAKRMNILGVKMASFHSLSQTLPFKINEGRPGAPEATVAREMARRLASLIRSGHAVDVRRSFGYAPLAHRIALKFLTQDYFHRQYRTVRADPARCTGCGSCLPHCPVNLIKIANRKAVRAEQGHYCLLCAECYHHCPRHAVIHEFLEQKIAKKLSAEQAKYHETPASAVYPLLSNRP